MFTHVPLSGHSDASEATLATPVDDTVGAGGEVHIAEAATAKSADARSVIHVGIEPRDRPDDAPAPAGQSPGGCDGLREAMADAARRVELKLASLAGGPETPAQIAECRDALHRDAFLLTCALAPFWAAGVMPAQVTVLNIAGGGVGLRSMLARALGAATVIHHNPFESDCDAARDAGAAVGLSADQYAVGEIASALRAGGLRDGAPLAVVSYDALEHIYNVARFLNHVVDAGTGPLALALGSAANACNRPLRRRLMLEQRRVEIEGRTAGHVPNFGGSGSGDSGYRAIRRRIITDAAPDLRPQQVDLLAHRTRGMRADDILKSVARLRAIGEYPPDPSHPTNTCDPISGNGCAQLHNPYVLATVLTAAGVPSRVTGGCYPGASGAGEPFIRRVARRAVNAAIRAGGSLGVRMAPFYCILGTRGVDDRASGTA